MRGTILGVHGGRGVLIGPNQERLEFPLSEWRSPGTPAPGQIVDFVETNGEAQGVFAVPGAASASSGVGTTSNATVMGAIGCVCLVLGFLIPFIPTIAAFVLFCLLPEAFPWLAGLFAALCFWTAAARVLEAYRQGIGIGS